MDLVLTPLYQTEQGFAHVSLIDKIVPSLIITFAFILLILPAPCILESCIKTFKASIKPLEAPQRRVKIKNKLICSLCIFLGLQSALPCSLQQVLRKSDTTRQKTIYFLIQLYCC